MISGGGLLGRRRNSGYVMIGGMSRLVWEVGEAGREDEDAEEEEEELLGGSLEVEEVEAEEEMVDES